MSKFYYVEIDYVLMTLKNQFIQLKDEIKNDENFNFLMNDLKYSFEESFDIIKGLNLAKKNKMYNRISVIEALSNRLVMHDENQSKLLKINNKEYCIIFNKN